MIVHKFPAAPGDSLLGGLQRGTGAGYLDALAADPAVARATLVSVIRLDWRWDHQLDSRSWYYAQLAEHFGMSSGEVESLILSTIDHDPSDAADEVAVQVLGQMASRGDDSAAERLIDYVRYGGCPEIAAGWCVADGTSRNLDRLHMALASRLPHKAAAARDTADLGWLKYWLEQLAEHDGRFVRFVRLIDWAEQAQAARTATTPPVAAEEFVATMSFEEGCRASLDTFRQGSMGYADWKARRTKALTWLEERFHHGHSTWLTEFLLEAHPESSAGHLGYLAALLPTEEWPRFVRRALADGRRGPRRAARYLIERSERPDADLVRGCLRAALRDNDMYAVCEMLDVVRRNRTVELVPDVEAAYRDGTYSYGVRLRAVETLEDLAPALFRERYARECLWDCEDLIIKVGCRHVDLDDLDVRPRLEFLRDEFDDDSDEDRVAIHRMASERLGY